MENIQSTLRKILSYNNVFDKNEARKVLIIYEQKRFMIGDSCTRFGNYKVCKHFFKDATIDICFNARDKFVPFYHAMLLNNPDLDRIYSATWEEVDFQQYDVIICAIPEEKDLLEALHRRWGALIQSDQLKLAIFSLSEFFIYQMHRGVSIFPRYDELFHSLTVYPGNKLAELYISRDERQWAEDWLRAQGLKEEESILIFLDSASRRDKLLRIDIYFEILTGMLARENIRVLVFDEKKVGKRAFYGEWLGTELSSRVIFSEGLSFREDLCLLGASRVKMVFGPCTGLMHCVSSIYNHFVYKGMSPGEAPLMITYTGQYPFDDTANDWWGNSPLVHCLLLKNAPNGVQMRLLSELTDEEKNDLRNVAPCTEYTPDMLMDFISRRLRVHPALAV